MKVIVTGGRTFKDRAWLFAGLDLLHSTKPISEIVEGGAIGADTFAYEWAYKREIKCTVIPAQWERYSAGLKHGQKNPAGAIRNGEMARLLDPATDLVFACPGGRGTQNMIDTAKARGLRVIFLEKMPVVRSLAAAA